MADELNHYGVAQYGYDTYGDIPPVGGAVVFPYPEVPGYCPQYLRFQLSGINQGLYVFELNPSSYDPYPQRSTQSYKTIINYDKTIDQQYNKLEIELQWDEMSEAMWNSLLPFSRKRVDGTSEAFYFWDSHINRFNGHRVKIESLKGEVKAGYTPINRFNVSMKIRVANT